MKKAVLISRLLAFVFALVAVLLFFLPLSSMTGEYREQYSSSVELIDSYQLFGDEIDMEAKDWLDLSMYNIAKICMSLEKYKTDAYLFYSLGSLAVLCAVFSLFKVPTLVILFDGCLGFMFHALINNLNPNLFNGSAGRIGGIAYTLYYPVIILIGISALVLFVTKFIYKRKS